MSDKVEWLPLESNPEVLINFMRKAGVKDNVEFVDVYGFDDDSLAFIPQPCYALLLCYPDVEKVSKILASEYEKLQALGSQVPEGMFFMKQNITNACGTFALIHSLVNNRDKIDLGDGSLKKWLDKSLKLSVNERSESLANDKCLAEVHASCALQGETEICGRISHHFICYINHRDTLYEIDSSAPSPRSFGATSEESFLKDASKVCCQLIKELENVSFSAMALIRTGVN